MDLSTYEVVSETSRVELYNIVNNTPIFVDDEKTVVMFVEVHGLYSKQYRRLQDAQQNVRLKRSRVGKRNSITSEELEEDRLQLIVDCIESWNIVLDGVTPVTTPVSIRAVFKRLPWLRIQIEAGMEDEQGFLKK